MTDGFAEISRLAAEGTPFLFIVSYDKSEIIVKRLDELNGIRFSIKGMTGIGNLKKRSGKKKNAPLPASRVTLKKKPVPFATYKKAFDRVIEEIERGNTYLLNLSFSTPIDISFNLEEVFDTVFAPYKLLVPGKFVCFTPEPFIRIEEDTISTYPMKGTIDASVYDAKAKILADKKEMAEHIMVVDLLRNDLGIVGSKVRVKRFRYIEKIVTADKTLLQVSSHIEAKLQRDWPERLGEILKKMLPAGSISGTPKKKTCEIIERIETHKRGFFTGIFGVFDGKNVDSAVMIRFIEKRADGFVYKSGGGITIDSDAAAEYREMIDKIYLPLY
ncbi:aminodeoxychorismate synthase component I [Hydrogenimonas urashimensis]|uniref:aminodeoxychorismate synthase component I n=1 Tax=Hydrogenimonas urashimensis TaxID=2740515 RepID=UPI001914FA05|nr:aminodeoxychorismate synthase component I [Hydrogenimonas urashimensis]